MFSLPGFAIKAQIYESANSLVYQGINQQDQTSVILKVLKEDYPTRTELTRYKQEYEIIRSLNVKGVIKAYSLQKYQNTFVIILEDFGGESLQKLMKESETFQFPMPLGEFLRLAIKITKILGRIHSSDVIHKDINPSNIILNSKTGQVKIIDFGISTRLTRTNLVLSHPQVLEGTLAYMSPEQTGRMNRSLDYRTDFYSLGVTFYELLTGQLPFTTTDALELVHCHIAKQPIPPDLLEGRETRSIVPQCPKAVSDIVMKLMAKTAEERYQSTWGIIADLEKCLLQLETSGRIQAFNVGTEDSSDQFQIPQKLYGREVEVSILLEAFERVIGEEAEREREAISSSKTEMVLVAGYSGIGKSVLVAEICKPITRKKGYFIAGKFEQFGRNIPYSAVVSALTKLMRQLLTESEASFHQWRTKILLALGSNAQLIIDVIPEVEWIIGKQQPVPELGLTEAQNRFNLVFQKFIRVFCDRKHPLVIFLDDLQWADTATLKLLQLILTDIDTQYLFLIGAYRDNEVNLTHPLMIMLEKLRQEGIIINQLTLAPLKLAHVSQLIAETLHSDTETVNSLAQLVLNKTGGNPFFIKELLKTLYAENLITFSLEKVKTQSSTLRKIPQWKWNISNIEAIDITDQVVELMIAALKKLPNSTQQIICLAACIGSSFDLNTLSMISHKSLQEVFRDLEKAIQQGLILPISELDEQLLIQNYQFRHDRIQQAAYLLMDGEAKKMLHLQIGRLILQNTLSDRLFEKIFEIVDHLNRGIELVSCQAERNEIAQLNLMAGKKAKAATAYDSAVIYFNQGRGNLAEDSWDSEYKLTLNLYIESIEVEYLKTDYLEVEKLYEVVEARAKIVLDKVRIYTIKIQCYSAKNQLKKAVSTALYVLEKLGVSLSHLPPQNLIVEDLYNLGLMYDPYKLAAMRVLMIVWGTAIIVTPDLVPSMAFTMVNLSLEYGNSPLAAFAYAYYGFNLCGGLSDIELGYQLGKLALRILDKFNAKEIQCTVNHVFNAFIRHWKEPVRESIKGLQETIQFGLETGDLEYTCYAAMQYSSYSLLVGEDLDSVKQKHTYAISLIQSLKQEFQLYYAKIWGQLALNLRGEASDALKLSGELFDETEHLPLLIQNKNDTSLFCVYLAKTILRYLFKDYENAITNATLAANYEPAIASLLPRGQLYFYSSLILLALYPTADSTQQIEYLSRVEEQQKQLKVWANHAPMNYLHKYELVEAEKARILGEKWEATELYEQAIQGASKNQYLHEEALAYELAAEFYLSQGRSKIAQTYFTEAYDGYVRWQATSKVRDLERRYPQFFSQRLSSLPKTRITTSNTSTEISSTLDLTTILKASQALSGELSLENLLAKMMKIVIENAGAQKGFLISRSLAKPGNANEQWMIEASGTVTSDQVQVLQSIPIEVPKAQVREEKGRGKREDAEISSFPVSDEVAIPPVEMPRVSNAIANYVIRTQKSVVLHDAVHEGDFTHDPYILQQQPKSILCMPLIHQGKLVGILYLENNLTTGAFTPERLEVLNLLSSQVAISLENAKLYAQLRESERKWTQILEAVPVGVSVYHPDGKVAYINQSGQRILGQGIQAEVSPEELAQTYQTYIAGTNQLYPTEQLPALRALNGETTILEDLEIHLNETIIPLEARTTPVLDEQGHIQYGVIAFQDITDRKQAEKILLDYNRTLEAEVTQRTAQLTQANQQLEQEISDRQRTQEALQQSETRYRAIIEDQTELVSRFLPDGTLTFINEAFCRYFEVKREDIIGKHYAPMVFADDLEQVEQQIQSISKDNPVVVIENRVVVAGQVRWTQWINRAIFNQQGDLVELQSIGRDISDKKQVELALQKSERRYRQIVETADEGIWVLDTEGNTVFANPKMAQMLGYSIEEMLGMSVFTFMDEQQQALAQQNLGRRRQGIVGKYDFKLRRKDGSDLWVIIASSPIFDESGQYTGALGMMTDITQRKAVEIALRQQKELLQTIFDHIPVMLCFYDANAQVQLANRALENTLGWSLEELRHIDIMAECYPDPEYRASVLEFMMRADGTWQDIQLKTRAGMILETCWANVRLPDGSQVGIGQDITARKRAEQALQESESRFREIAETIRQFFFVRSATSGQYLYANPAYEQIWGRTCESLYQSPQSWIETIHPDDRQFVIHSIQEQFQGQPIKREYRIIRPDGQERWIAADISIICDETGQPLRFVGLAEDITERKQAEAALRESENRFRAVFEHAAVGIGLCTLEGRFFRINQKLCDIVGYTDAEMLERTFEQITPVKDRPQMREYIQQLVTGKIENYSLEHRYICKDGSLVWVNVAVSLMHEPTGEPKSFIYVTEDISDRKRAEEELQQAKLAAEAANQAKSAFLANMSHELRTPLNAILGFSQLIVRSSSLSPEHKKNLDTIIHSGEHLLTLINQVLDLSKIEAGRATLNETNFNLYHFLDEVKDMFQLKANNKRLQLNFERTLDVPQYIRTDEVKLRQVLINLLSNAIKFTTSGSVSLRVSRGINQAQESTHSQPLIPDSPLHFEIEDTGSGIAPEELESIFEAFVQTKIGQQFQEGTGLGLTITRKFVQLMGGEISINSQVGKGTVIAFDIQASAIAATDIEPQLPIRRVIALEPNQPTYRLLIVDDHADNRQVLIELLSPFGFELKQANNGLEALAIWEDWKPHLIFIDMRMPVMDGYEATKQIRAKEKKRREEEEKLPPKTATVIIAVTASSLEEERNFILSMGCDDFIGKPFPEAEIFSTLHQHLGVRFIYDEPTATPPRTQTQTKISIPTAIATLPADLVADFRQALLELDVEQVQTSMTQIRLLNEPLAEALAPFANKFQYEQLLNLISP